MTDFYSVLRRALDRVGAVDDAGARDRVYTHVREGMVRRLYHQQPPLADDVISDRIDEFEAAIARIEEEVAESVFAEADLEQEVHPEPAYAGEWHGRIEETRGPAPIPESNAPPESIWGTADIDLAWNETTEQWHDPAAVPPAEPGLPVGGWEERLGFALSDDRAPAHDVDDDELFEEEADVEDVPEYRTPKRRGRFSRGGRGRPSRSETVTVAPGGPAPRQATGWRGLWRRHEQRGVAMPNGYAPVADIDLGVSEPAVRPRRRLKNAAPAERAMFYLEDRTLQSDAAAIVVAAREARVIDVEFEEDGPDINAVDVGVVEPRPSRFARTPGAAVGDLSGMRRRTGASRAFTVAISVLALIVAVWCGYVFLPMIFPNPETGQVQLTAEEPAAAVAAANGAIVLFAGEDPAVFEGGPDNPVRYEVDEQGGFVRLASSTTGGFRAVVGPGVAELLGGHDIRVVLEVRAAPTRPSLTMRIGYLRGTRLLEWRTIGLGSEFEIAALDWAIPPGPGAVPDALIIEPGIPGDGTALEIRSLGIQILD